MFSITPYFKQRDANIRILRALSFGLSERVKNIIVWTVKALLTAVFFG
jgi:hypothetical protein